MSAEQVNGTGTATPPPLPRPQTRKDAMEADFAPMEGRISVWSVVEGLLRHPGRVVYELERERAPQVMILQLLAAVVCLLAYGVTVGMFSWGQQIWAAPVKIAGGVLFSALICLPSLFIFSCLAGSESRIREVTGVLVGCVCLAALLLLGFAPVSWIFSQSTDSVFFMGILHIVFWSIGLKYALEYVRGAFRLLRGKDSIHLATWGIIFILVTLQMTTTLRPIVGTSDRFLQTEKKFFVAHWFENMSEASEQSSGRK